MWVTEAKGFLFIRTYLSADSLRSRGLESFCHDNEYMFELWNQYVKKSWRAMLNISKEKLKPADWMSILQKRQSELKTKDFKRRKNWSTFISSLHSEKNTHYGSSMMLEGKTLLERPRSLQLLWEQFTWKGPSKAVTWNAPYRICKYPSRSFLVTSLTVHGVHT